VFRNRSLAWYFLLERETELLILIINLKFGIYNDLLLEEGWFQFHLGLRDWKVSISNNNIFNNNTDNDTVYIVYLKIEVVIDPLTLFLDH